MTRCTIVYRHAVIDKPRGSGVPKIMKPWSRIKPRAQTRGFPDAGVGNRVRRSGMPTVYGTPEACRKLGSPRP